MRMRPSIVVTITATTLAGILAVSGCGSASTSADTSELVSPASRSAAEGVTTDFRANMEHPDGYTGVLHGSVNIDPFVVEDDNSEPGFVELVRPKPNYTAVFENTTEGRAAPVPYVLRAYAYYPLSAGVCELYTAYPPEPEIPRNVDSVSTDGTYCYVDVLIATADTLEDVLPAASSLAYGPSGSMTERQVGHAASMAEVPQDEAAALAETLNNPLGIIIGAGAIGTIHEPEPEYTSDVDCAGLPVTTMTDRDREVAVPGVSVANPGAITVVGATGPIC